MVFRESKLRVVLSMAAPVLLIAMAVMVGIAGGPFWVTAVLALLGLALGWFVLFDFTTALFIDESGIALVYPVRQRLITWESIERLFNPRRRGLVAVTVNGEHHILIDRKLDPEELDMLSNRAKAHGVKFQG